MGRKYPKDWPQIAAAVKVHAGHRCQRCRHPADRPWSRWPASGEPVSCDQLCRHIGGGRQRVLTVHHLDWNPMNSAWWNLIALCQSCHLIIENMGLHLHQYFLLEPPDWLKTHVEGWINFVVFGVTVTPDYLKPYVEE